MAKKRPAAVLQKEKLQKIDELFKVAEPILRDPEKIKALKENSTLRRFCTAARLYIDGLDVKEGCIRIYKIFHIHALRSKDIPLTDRIKNRLKAIKHPSPPEQLELFT